MMVKAMGIQGMNENIALLCQKYPAVANLIEQEGGTTILDYLKKMRHRQLPEIMPSKDLLEETQFYFTPFFGNEIARKASLAIEHSRCISTSNHHHPAFEFMTVQETILYDIWLRMQKEEDSITPFFAASNVSISNTVYPRGMLIYDCSLPKGYFRLPIYHWKLTRQCVAALEGITPEMVTRVKDRIGKEMLQGTFDHRMGDTLTSLCNDILLSNEVLKYDTLREQTTVINAMLSKRYFKDNTAMYLWMPLETLATRLLFRDLRHEDGILYNILFCKELRTLLLQGLNGVSGCWTEDAGGTHFFWGLDSHHILFPLRLIEKNGDVSLNGRNSQEEEVDIPFTKEAILEELDKLTLLPGLFLCFLEIHFLRDFTVFGGYFQPTYLRQMANGLVKSLRMLKVFEEEASIIESKANYMTLGLTYLFRENSRGKYPVSTAELFEEPVSLNELKSLMDITIEDSLSRIAF